ncbi:TonB-dependent receptor domain protein [Xanthomonas citri pv. punicae str. LMG 859]|nr:TonB-dependent receptor domain protein [Xanthomonas citri pv. punicae str. LMG 859]
MRAQHVEVRDSWPWPSGMLAGMPSTNSRTPRTPKVERAPKPRIDSWVSCA